MHLGADAAFVPARRAHPALVVDDLDVAGRDLAAAGVSVTGGDRVDGRRQLYVADPFGNRLELLQDGDGFSQR